MRPLAADPAGGPRWTGKARDDSSEPLRAARRHVRAHAGWCCVFVPFDPGRGASAALHPDLLAKSAEEHGVDRL